MTLNDWCKISDEHYIQTWNNDIIACLEWDSWEQKINNVLNDMAYEDAAGCNFEDLISLAGLTEEVGLALKKQWEDEKMNRIKEDF